MELRTSITAPIDNVEDIVNNLSAVNPKTGFQQQFEVCLPYIIFV